MKKILCGITGLLILLAFNSYAEEAKTTAAVIDLEAREGVSSDVALMLSDYLRAQLINTNKFTLVTRENMGQILKEQQFQMFGCTSNECIIQMGQLLGVHKIFTGSMGKIGTTYLISLKIIDVESGKIERAEIEKCVECKEDALLVSIENIAEKIMLPSVVQTKSELEIKPEPQITKPIVKLLPASIIEPKFKGRFGLGLNYLGLQLRYGVSNSFLLEGKVQFGSFNTLIGGRGYFLWFFSKCCRIIQ